MTRGGEKNPPGPQNKRLRFPEAPPDHRFVGGKRPWLRSSRDAATPRSAGVGKLTLAAHTQVSLGRQRVLQGRGLQPRATGRKGLAGPGQAPGGPPGPSCACGMPRTLPAVSFMQLPRFRENRSPLRLVENVAYDGGSGATSQPGPRAGHPSSAGRGRAAPARGRPHRKASSPPPA